MDYVCLKLPTNIDMVFPVFLAQHPVAQPVVALGVLSVQISSKTEQNGITAGQPHIMAWPVGQSWMEKC